MNKYHTYNITYYLCLLKQRSHIIIAIMLARRVTDSSQTKVQQEVKVLGKVVLVLDLELHHEDMFSV